MGVRGWVGAVIQGLLDDRVSEGFKPWVYVTQRAGMKNKKTAKKGIGGRAKTQKGHSIGAWYYLTQGGFEKGD